MVVTHQYILKKNKKKNCPEIVGVLTRETA